jgi:hypothetical protein
MDKIALIIPLYKQSQFWSKILKAIENQSKLPNTIYLMLDRPALDDVKVIEEINSHSKLNIKTTVVDDYPSLNKSDDLFLAPYVRNIGINLAIQDGCDKFVFIDGDCIPQNKLIESHLNKIKYNVSILSVGRRRESIYRWQDRREFVSELTHLDLFRKNGLLINNPDLLKRSLIVWTCNIAMNLQAIKLVKKLNKKYYNRDEVFCSDFIGKWGGEDGFLGIEAYYCRVFITTIGEKNSGIEHIDHPRPEEKYTIKHMEFFNKQVELLRQKIALNPLELNFYTIN